VWVANLSVADTPLILPSSGSFSTPFSHRRPFRTIPFTLTSLTIVHHSSYRMSAVTFFCSATSQQNSVAVASFPALLFRIKDDGWRTH
jgi:hypothetical protein